MVGDSEISMTVAELADRVGGSIEGDSTRVIRGIAPLDRASPDDISWVGTQKFASKAGESHAAALIVERDAPTPPGATVIRVVDPDATMCDVLALFAPPVDGPSEGIHPSAVVSAGADVQGASVGSHVHVGSHAVVGAGTQLHHGVYVGSHARIGRDCVIWPNVVIRERVILGDRVVIHPNATIGADGFSYLFRDGKHRKVPQIGTVVVEDDVEIGAGSAIDRARSGSTRIGRGTKIDNQVQIGHNAVIGEDCILVAHVAVGGSSTLGRNVVLAGQVGVTDHCHIGDGAMVAAPSAVMNDVDGGTTVRGMPATEHRRFLRQQAALRRLPDLMQRIREMRKQIERLERLLGDDAGGQ